MMYYESPYDPVFARGDSVALAVQAGKISFEPSTYSEELRDLVSQMTIVDVEFRTNIDSVMEKVEVLRTDSSCSSTTDLVTMSR